MSNVETNYNMLQKISERNVDYKLLKNVIIIVRTIHYFTHFSHEYHGEKWLLGVKKCNCFHHKLRFHQSAVGYNVSYMKFLLEVQWALIGWR